MFWIKISNGKGQQARQFTDELINLINKRSVLRFFNFHYPWQLFFISRLHHEKLFLAYYKLCGCMVIMYNISNHNCSKL